MIFEFEWDPRKAGLNWLKHQVRFKEAASVFHDPQVLSIYDSEHSVEEDRWITIGVSALGRLLIVCHTIREIDVEQKMIRIISCRKATPREAERYARE